MTHDIHSPENLSRLKGHLLHALAQELERRPPAGINLLEETRQRLEAIFSRAGLQMDDAVRELVLHQVLDEAMAYGPIQPLLDDPTISEIMVNGPGNVFIERNGELIETGIKFQSEEHLLRIINRMLAPLGKRVDQDTPMADARLPGGSRANIVIPPVSTIGSCVTIRKFLRNRMTIDELIALEALTPHMAEFLQACVAARLNILISGATSSGKTTFLNVLSSFIPEHERVVTIEDAVELQLRQKHVISLETRPPSVDGSGAVTTRDLVRNALRMRPDRIIVGEVRSAEALDMLQALNTGHTGSLTTLHANTPRDATSRLETMVMMAGLDLPLAAIRRQIASAINVVIHQSRLADGTRKTTQITEISGMEGEIITMSDIFKYEQSGIGPNGKIIGRLTATGLRPMFTPRLEIVGYKLRPEIFGAPAARLPEASGNVERRHPGRG